MPKDALRPRPAARPWASLVAPVALCLSACGGNDEPPPADPQGSPEAPNAAAGSGGAADIPAPYEPEPIDPARFRGPWLEAEELESLPRQGPDLIDEAAERGLDYVNASGEAHKPTILGANGAGVAALDLGSDGDPDLVFGQGLPAIAAVQAGAGARLAVFENDGEGRFARAPSPEALGWWTGLAAGDVDGDGDADLAAGGYGGLLLCAQRDGALVPWSDRPGGGLMDDGAPAGAWLAPGAERDIDAGPPRWTTSLAFLDADLDGDLDLYVGRYLDLDPAAPPRGELGEGALAFPCWWKGIEVYCGPRGMTAQPDVILRGDGAGGFEDATADWLTEQAAIGAGFTLAVGTFDADFDGDVDLYVANDSTANLLWVNEVRGAAGGFVDRALTAGVALNPEGAAEAGMGAAFGDVNRDGRLDLAVTNFSDEPTHLYLGRERGFGDVTYRFGLQHESRRLLSWSTHLEDFDGDGHLELFTANGHVYPQADTEGTGTRYAQADSLWRLPASGRVERVLPRRADSALARIAGSRGSAIADFDRDGAPDLCVTTVDGPAILAMNRLAPDARRLVVVLEGKPQADGPARSTRDAVGAKVILVPALPPGAPIEAEFALLKEVRTAVGYQSASSTEVFLGLGATDRYTRLAVLWPSGRTEELGEGAAGRRLFLREGEGIVREEEL